MVASGQHRHPGRSRGYRLCGHAPGHKLYHGSRHDSSRADVFFLTLSHNVTEATNKLIYEFKEHISAGAMAAV
jgi:hypothetical protein